MSTLSSLLILIVAIEHLYILWLEMFAWTTHAPKVFRNFPKEHFEKTKAMAANQGLYNGFLSAGLIWGLMLSQPEVSRHVTYFFLSCIVIAGIYGAYSVQRSIFFVQALPALLALVLTFLAS